MSLMIGKTVHGQDSSWQLRVRHCWIWEKGKWGLAVFRYIRVWSINSVMLTLILLMSFLCWEPYQMFYLYVTVLTIYSFTVLFDLYYVTFSFLKVTISETKRFDTVNRTRSVRLNVFQLLNWKWLGFFK